MASKAATHYLQFDIQWSSLALLFYDYALTFPLEVKYIWGSKARMSTVLYIFCRYALVANVLYLLAIANRLKQGVCDTWYKIIGALSVLGRAAVILTFTGRIYAIYARSKYVLIYLSFLGLVCIALDITHVPGLRCVGSSSIPLAPLLLSILMIVFEFSAALLTVIRCLTAFKAAGGRKNQSKGLMNLIFEQGVLYFSIVTIITTAALILNVKAPAGFLQRLLNAYLLPLSGLLTARFLLHIRVYEDKQELRALGGARSRVHASSTLASFRAVAGDMVSGLVDQFGDDPVETAQRQTMGGASHSSATSGGAGTRGDIIPLVEPKSGDACATSSDAA